MDRKFEQAPNGESLGIPKDLFSDPARYDEQIPLWKRTVGFVKQYEKSKPKGREVLLEQLANSAVKDLSTLNPLFDNFALASQSRPDIDFEEITDGFIKHLEKSATRSSALSSWTPTRIEQLMKLGLEEEGRVQQTATKIKAVVFNAPDTIQESVDLHYNAAWAMVATIDPKVREELFSGLCLEKDWFKETSFCALAFHFGSLETGEIYSKYSAARKALEYVGHLFNVLHGLSIKAESRRVKTKYLRAGTAAPQLPTDLYNRMHKLSMEAMQKHPGEIQRQIDYFAAGNSDYTQPFLYTRLEENEDLANAVRKAHEKETRRLGKLLEEPTKDDKPYNDLLDIITTNISPLIFRVFTENEFLRYKQNGFEKLTKIPVQLPDSAVLSIAAKGCQTVEQRNAIIREVYESIVQKKAVNPSRTLLISLDQISEAIKVSQGFISAFDKEITIAIAIHRPIPTEEFGRLSSILEYHRPPISPEQYAAINQKLKELKNDLKIKFTKSVGKRGYSILVSDPLLREMGYRMLTFRQEDKGGRLSTGLQLAGQQFEFSLDPNYGLILGKDFKKIVSPQDQAWLELLTLSHLKKVMCTDEDDIADDLVGGQKQLEIYRKQMIHRAEHLRRQVPGRNFSTEAFSKCLKSHLPMRNLLEINRLRAGINLGGTLQTGIWTYVSGVEKDIDTQTAKPVKVAFKGASDDMRKVIPLGEISAEEVNRIEQEILAELEVA